MPENTEDKRCFVVSPIGDEGSNIRERADLVYNNIIKPAMLGIGFKTERSDEQYGSEITPEIINSILEFDLVIIDLTGHNPNVFYELAIAHLREKPFIQIAESQTKIPFDAKDIRTIFYDLSDVVKTHSSFEKTRTSIAEMASALLKAPKTINSPVIEYLRKRGEELRQDELGNGMQNLSSKLSEVQAVVRKFAHRPELHAQFLREINEGSGSRAMMIASLATIYSDVAPWLQSLGTDAYRETVSQDGEELLPIVKKFLQEVEEFNQHPIVTNQREIDRISDENVSLIEAVVQKIRDTETVSA